MPKTHHDPDALRTTLHRSGSPGDATIALVHQLSRESTRGDEPLVDVRVVDAGHRSFATVKVRDEQFTDSRVASLDLDLDDAREMAAAFAAVVDRLATLEAADLLIPRVA